MAQWTMDLNKYCEKKKTEFKEVRKSYAFALYSSIVKKTPVDTGRARGNWNITVGHDDTTASTRTKPQFKSVDEVPKVEGDETIYISNNLPYITKLEYGGYPNPPKGGKGKTINGYSKQAPEGMVGVTLANNKNIFDSAVRAVKGGK